MRDISDPDPVSRGTHRTEQDRLDEIGDASFPASDPPGWTPVVRIGRPAGRASGGAKATTAPASRRLTDSAGAVP